MRLIFIRHGDPDYTIDSLTEKGWREAELLSKRVLNWDVRDFYSSPLGRAKDTCNVSLKKLNRSPEILPWLREFHSPVKDTITGNDRIPWDFLPQHWTKQDQLFHKDTWFDAPLMETGDLKNNFSDVTSHLDELLATYGYHRENGYYSISKPNEDTIVFFCHLGVTFAMMAHLLNISPVLLWQGFFIAPSSVTILNSEERDGKNAYFRCHVLGDTTHLHDGGEPISKSGYFTEVFQK